MLKETLMKIDMHKNSNPLCSELMDILEEILILREEYRIKIKENIFRINESLIEKKLSGGLPLIDFSVKDFDFTEPEKYFFKLLKETKNRLPGDVEEIIKKIEGDSFDFREMVMASFAVQEEEAAQEDEEDEDETETDDEKDVLDLVEFFVEESLRPALEIFAEKYSDVIKRSGWSEGYCPVCASEPKIGKVEGEGDEIRRFLFCSQCGFEWEFTPDKCPFCGNEDQRTMESFSVEDDERYYVEVCNECNRYIKTVNIGETKEETNLDVEDIATLHLDMLANEEGYR